MKHEIYVRISIILNRTRRSDNLPSTCVSQFPSECSCNESSPEVGKKPWKNVKTGKNVHKDEIDETRLKKSAHIFT